MRFRWTLAVLATALGAAGCGSGSAKKTGADAGAASETLYARLGKQPGIEAVVEDFLSRVLSDEKINGYFLNSTLDQQHLADCLVQQVAAATGGPDPYTCRSMKDAHSGLGISKQDFDDLVNDLTAALVAANVKQADIDTILGVLGPMSTDIVEDPTNDATIYQRIGRKPAIDQVVTDFHANVAKDTTINSFFATADLQRLAACLVRQVCQATGGPCQYGNEILSVDAGLSEPCRDMKTAHTGLGIAVADFNALVGDLVSSMDADGVSMTDRNSIVSALAPLCSQVVEKNPANCPQ